MKKIVLAFMVIISIILCGCNKEDIDLETTKNQSDLEFSNTSYLSLDFDTVKSTYGPADTELDKLMLVYEGERIYNYGCDKAYLFEADGSFKAIMYDIYCNSRNSQESYENIRTQLIDEYGDDYKEESGGTAAKLNIIIWENIYPDVVISLSLTYGDVEEDSLTFMIGKDTKS